MKIFQKQKSKLVKKKEEEKFHVCKNCSTGFFGYYCPHCGQSSKEFNRPIKFMFDDFLGNMFAFDTRFWNTFKTIILCPGEISIAFSKGKIIKYMPPFRFFIFSSFIFFFVLNWTSQEENNIIDFDNSENKENILVNNKADSIFNNVLSKHTKSLDNELVTKEIKDELLKNKIKLAYDNLSIYNIYIYKDSSLKLDRKTNYKLATLLDDYNKHPDYYISKILKTISWLLFLLMPFYGLLLKLAFSKSYKYYVTHLIFSLTEHTYLFVLISVFLIFNEYLPIGLNIIPWLILLILVGLRIKKYREVKNKNSLLYKRDFKIKKEISRFVRYTFVTLGTSIFPYLIIPIFSFYHHFKGGSQLYKQNIFNTYIKLISIGIIYWIIVFVIIIIVVIWPFISTIAF